LQYEPESGLFIIKNMGILGFSTSLYKEKGR